MPDIHPFAIELTEKVKRKNDQVFTLKLRELLKGFGYSTRTEDSMPNTRRNISGASSASTKTAEEFAAEHALAVRVMPDQVRGH